MYNLNLTLEKIANLCCYHLKIIFIAHVYAQVIKLNEDLFIISLTRAVWFANVNFFACVYKWNVCKKKMNTEPKAGKPYHRI